MRITIDGSLTEGEAVDLDVRPGTPVQEVVAWWVAAHGEEGQAVAKPVWCGASTLDSAHLVGTWPLRTGARLSAHATRPCAAPVGLHVAAFAGPDAGLIVPLGSLATLGSEIAPVRSEPMWIVRDDAVEAIHATLSPVAGGAVRVLDASTVNGTEVWSLRRGRIVSRGRRRSALARVGDVITLGRTSFEVRDGGSRPDAMTSPGDESCEPGGRIRSLVDRVASALGVLPRDQPPAIDHRLDPTAPSGWAGFVEISGIHAPDLARAVILARGRRPPPPLPLDEPWLSWLPPAREGDGTIVITAGGDGAIASPDRVKTRLPPDVPSLRLVAARTHTALVTPEGTSVAPPTHVRADTADSLARSLAGRDTDPAPHHIRWADAAMLAAPIGGLVESQRDPQGIAVVSGVSRDNPSTRWEVSLDEDSRHVLVAGATGTGKSTLLATIACAVAATTSPDDVELVIMCAGDPGPLEPCFAMPHVRIVLSRTGPQQAMRALSLIGEQRLASPRANGPAPDSSARKTIVIADDIHTFGADGRGVTQALERLAVIPESGARVHLILSTARPSAVLSPRLRAAMTTVVALRANSDADSIESIGVARAAHLPSDSPGAALVRDRGRLERVQVAIPLADRAAAVRLWGGTEASGAHLATVAKRPRV